MRCVFNAKNKKFNISLLKLKNISKEYIESLKESNFIVYPKYTLNDQRNYVRKIKKSQNIILEIIYNKKLVATSGFQKNKGKVFQGILITDKKFRGKGYANFFIFQSLLFFKKLKGVNIFFAGIDKNNLPSIYAFKRAGYKLYNKRSSIFKINLK
jgi:RimJ/RimL family protein N-acetyltransferase